MRMPSVLYKYKLIHSSGFVTGFPFLSALTSAALFLVICFAVLFAFFLPAIVYIPESPSEEYIPPPSPEASLQRKRKTRAVFSDSSDEDEKPFRSRRTPRQSLSPASNGRPRPHPSVGRATLKIETVTRSNSFGFDFRMWI